MRILAFDDTQGASRRVRWMARWVGWWFFDATVRAKSWASILEACKSVRGAPVELHVWGPTAPKGREQTPHVGIYAVPKFDRTWEHVDRVWFRSGYSLAGSAGIDLAKRLQRYGVDVAGHVGPVGIFRHRGLVGVNPRQEPWWTTGSIPQRARWCRNRDVTALRQHLPKWWNRPDKRST